MAECIVSPLETLSDKSLLHIRLLTGRKRQLRAQLAACDHPIIGDARYGKPGKLKLHSCRVILPDAGPEITCLPAWQKEFHIITLPPAICFADQKSQDEP